MQQSPTGLLAGQNQHGFLPILSLKRCFCASSKACRSLGLPVPDLPQVFQAAFVARSDLDELLGVFHLDIRQVHSLLVGHPAGTIPGTIPGVVPAPAPSLPHGQEGAQVAAATSWGSPRPPQPRSAPCPPSLPTGAPRGAGRAGCPSSAPSARGRPAASRDGLAPALPAASCPR